MEIPKFVKQHPYRAGTIAVVSALLIAGETTGYLQNRSYNVPHNACISPPAVSGAYVDPDANLWLQTYTGAFTTGVVASGQVPKDAYGVQASFKSPDAGPGEWDNNASRMIKPDKLGNFAFKMAIGNGEVQFGVRVIARKNSPLCSTPPATAYDYMDQGEYFRADGALPWPNPVNVLTNLIP